MNRYGVRLIVIACVFAWKKRIKGITVIRNSNNQFKRTSNLIALQMYVRMESKLDLNRQQCNFVFKIEPLPVSLTKKTHMRIVLESDKRNLSLTDRSQGKVTELGQTEYLQTMTKIHK